MEGRGSGGVAQLWIDRSILTASEERGEFALVRRLADTADTADVVEVTLVAADAVAVLRRQGHGNGNGNGHGDGHRGVGSRFRTALHQ